MQPADLASSIEAHCRQRLGSDGVPWDEHDALRCQICQVTAPLLEALETEREAHEQAMNKAERDLYHEIGNRDELAERCDQLAGAIASQDRIGEHSSANCPWENALEIARSVDEFEDLEFTRDALVRALRTARDDLADAGDSDGAARAEMALNPWRVSHTWRTAADAQRLRGEADLRFEDAITASRHVAAQALRLNPAADDRMQAMWRLASEARRLGGLPDPRGGHWLIADERSLDA